MHAISFAGLINLKKIVFNNNDVFAFDDSLFSLPSLIKLKLVGVFRNFKQIFTKMKNIVNLKYLSINNKNINYTDEICDDKMTLEEINKALPNVELIIL